MQSSCNHRIEKLHVAVIMDGNGRWAVARELPRAAGHREGVAALRRTIEAAVEAGIGTLTVYAFSADNWKRPASEVSLLMALLRSYLTSETGRLIEEGVKLTVIGRRDRIGAAIAAGIAEAETATAPGSRLHLRIALDYSSREAIFSAAHRLCGEELTREAFVRSLSGGEGVGDVDLVIRTSGEQRLSDFLLWECAYAELYFTNRLWPDFGATDFHDALAAFHRRDRKFGGASPEPGVAAGAAAGRALFSGVNCHE